ncbi:uncharacterized protein LOC141993703 [Natator depressus]|uniref:uncharacterized protein LOC141993703 n=1 Tax=Natator depressus TaxID=27790 RepID=UPI003EB7C912
MRAEGHTVCVPSSSLRVGGSVQPSPACHLLHHLLAFLSCTAEQSSSACQPACASRPPAFIPAPSECLSDSSSLPFRSPFRWLLSVIQHSGLPPNASLSATQIAGSCRNSSCSSATLVSRICTLSLRTMSCLHPQQALSGGNFVNFGFQPLYFFHYEPEKPNLFHHMWTVNPMVSLRKGPGPKPQDLNILKVAFSGSSSTAFFRVEAQYNEFCLAV